MMIALGLVLVVLGLLFGSGILWMLGLISLGVGIIFWVLGALGRPLGRAHYY